MCIRVFQRLLKLFPTKASGNFFLVFFFSKAYGSRISKTKTTSKIFVKFESTESLLPEHDNDRNKAIAWAKEQAHIYTEAEKQGLLTVDVALSEATGLKLDEKSDFNFGYLFPKMVYHQLDLLFSSF